MGSKNTILRKELHTVTGQHIHLAEDVRGRVERCSFIMHSSVCMTYLRQRSCSLALVHCQQNCDLLKADPKGTSKYSYWAAGDHCEITVVLPLWFVSADTSEGFH